MAMVTGDGTRGLTRRLNMLAGILGMFGGMNKSLMNQPHKASIPDHSTHKYTKSQAKARKHKRRMVKESKRRNWA